MPTFAASRGNRLARNCTDKAIIGGVLEVALNLRGVLVP